jgi:protein KTI12
MRRNACTILNLYITSFDNLIMRFEEPSSMARWDSPLFAISWDDDLEGAGKSILDDLWVAVTQGAKKGPTAAVVTVSQSVGP